MDNRVYSILISHNRPGYEDWRMMRVLAAAQDFSRLWPGMACFVQRLHDHKGELFVTFRGLKDPNLKKKVLNVLEAVWDRHECSNVREMEEPDNYMEGERVFIFTDLQPDYWQGSEL